MPTGAPTDTSIYVEKLGEAGFGVAWKAAAGFYPPMGLLGEWAPLLAADAQGRAYVTAPVTITAAATKSLVVRLNAAGSAIDYTATVTGFPTSIAVDGSGAVVVAGYVSAQTGPTGFVTRVAPDTSTLRARKAATVGRDAAVGAGAPFAGPSRVRASGVRARRPTARACGGHGEESHERTGAGLHQAGA